MIKETWVVGKGRVPARMSSRLYNFKVVISRALYIVTLRRRNLPARDVDGSVHTRSMFPVLILMTRLWTSIRSKFREASVETTFKPRLVLVLQGLASV